MSTATRHRCASCDRLLPVASDQMGPDNDEVAVDTAQIVAVTPDWVCGHCLEEASDPRWKAALMRIATSLAAEPGERTTK